MRYRDQRVLGAIVLGVMGSAGCNLSDQVITRQPGTPCASDGARSGDLVCTDGAWTIAPTPDMPVSKSDMPADLPLTPVDSPPDMTCVGESDEELCTALGRCALDMSVVDRCDAVRTVSCPDTCAMGICIPATGLCEGDCVPMACPPTTECARVSNGCGAMQICDACPDGTQCDPDQNMCVCEPPDTASVCAADTCGVITVMNTCGESTEVACGACENGYCDESGSCAMLDVVMQPKPSSDARFGASLDLDAPYLIVGAPGEQSAGDVGNAYIFELDVRSWVSRHDARSDTSSLREIYSGFAMGSDVAISATSEVALIGKSRIDAGQPYEARIALLYRDGSTWRDGLTLSSEGITAGRVVEMFGEHAILGAPARQDNQGLVNVYTFVDGDPSQPLSRTYRGKNDGDRVGDTAHITRNQLIFGAPGTNSDQGVCHIALLDTSGENWSESQTVEAHDPVPGARFCEHVLLRPNIFVATFSGRMVNGAPVDTVQIFTSTDDGETWKFAQEIVDPSGTAEKGFGSAMVFANDGTLFIADPLEANLGGDEEAGVVYRYDVDSSGDYVLTDEIRSSAPVDMGRFGSALGTSKELLVIGAPGEPADGNERAGIVYTLNLPQN